MPLCEVSEQADYFGELINSKAEVKKLLKENRTVFDAIMEALEWLGNKLGLHNKDITEARELFRQALDEADAEVWGEEARKSDADVLSRSEEWHPDLTRNQLDNLMKIIDNDIKKSTRRITNNANWLMTRMNGMSVFAIYSIVYPYNPTLLYESKGSKAVKEKELLLKYMEAEENGKNNVAKSIQLNKLLDGNGIQEINGIQDNNAGTSFGKSNSGNGGILQGTSPKFIGSAAFRSVLQNILETSEETGRRDKDGNELKSRSDTEYLELTKNPEKNEAKLRKLVEEAAKRAGYDSPLVHHVTSKENGELYTFYESKAKKEAV